MFHRGIPAALIGLCLTSVSQCADLWSIERVLSDRSIENFVELATPYSGSLRSKAIESDDANSSREDSITFTHARIITPHGGKLRIERQLMARSEIGNSTLYIFPTTAMKTLPPRENLESLHTIDEFEKLLGPCDIQDGFTDSLDRETKSTTLTVWRRFSLLEDRSLRVLFVEIEVQETGNGNKLVMKRIRDGIFLIAAPSENN